jgi:hypothetical protein
MEKERRTSNVQHPTPNVEPLRGEFLKRKLLLWLGGCCFGGIVFG